ncbi:MAG: hypothetical protein KGZ38_07245 [Erysipelothrix sp.]|jgi:rod shape-determining protein MreD|nr:hypothetical protein [Erysipelothrix sp.]
MNKVLIYVIAIMLDLFLISLINQITFLSYIHLIPVNTFFFIVLLHTHDQTITFKEIFVLFTLGFGLDILYATPLFMNAVSLVLVVVIAHQVKIYFNDNSFERIMFLLITLFLKELFNYAILFVTLKTTLQPQMWFIQRVFFVISLNIPMMILAVRVFSQYQDAEKKSIRRQRQKESTIQYIR